MKKRVLLSATEEPEYVGDEPRGKFVLTWREPAIEHREFKRIDGSVLLLDVESYREVEEEWPYYSADERAAQLAATKALMAEFWKDRK